MLGPETYIVRSADDAMALRARAGDYVWIDPDVPLADGGLVAVRDPDRGAETVVRRFVEHDGRRTGPLAVSILRTVSLLKVVPRLVPGLVPVRPIRGGLSRNLRIQINDYLSVR